MAQPAAAGVRPRGPGQNRRALGPHFAMAHPDRGPQHARSLVFVSKRPPAADGTARGALWSILIAVGFFLLSHPRDMFPRLTTSVWWIMALSLLVVLIDVRRVRWPVPPWTVLLFLGVCSASVMWSISPSDTVRAVGLYGAIALFASLVAANTDTPALLRGIVWGALIVAGVALWAVWTDRTGSGGPIGVRPIVGVHGNRNVLSYTLLLGLCAVLSYRPQGRVRSFRWGAALLIVLGTLVLARSGTGLVSATVLIIVAVVLATARRFDLFASLRSRVIGLVAVVTTVVIGLLNVDAIFDLFGKKGDFSGRMPVWKAILEVWSESPVGGYGWGAIWQYSWFHAEPNVPKAVIDQKAGLWYAHGHNSVFDIVPQLGVIGVVSFVVIVVFAVRSVFVHVDQRERMTVRWITMGMLGFLVCGITEPMISIPAGWFMIVTIAAGAQRLAQSRNLVV